MENEGVLPVNKIPGTKTWDEIEFYAKEQKQRQEEHIERFPELIMHPSYKDEKKQNSFQHMMESRLNRYNEEDLHGKEMRKEMHLCKFCHYLTSFMGGAAL